MWLRQELFAADAAGCPFCRPTRSGWPTGLPTRQVSSHEWLLPRCIQINWDELRGSRVVLHAGTTKRCNTHIPESYQPEGSASMLDNRKNVTVKTCSVATRVQQVVSATTYMETCFREVPISNLGRVVTPIDLQKLFIAERDSEDNNKWSESTLK